MAEKKNPIFKEERNFHSFTTVLTLTACEWCLIFLLLIHAVISYALTKFAYYCKLQTPCILCSRLDHIFSNEKFDGYQSLLCRNHKFEMSSLVSGHIHGKHVDVNEMCKDCLCSFATKSMAKTNSDVNTLSKLMLDFDGSGCPSSSLDRIPGFIWMRPCSSCGKPWRSNSHPFTKPKVPLPHLPSHNHRDRLKKARNKYSCSKSLQDCKNLCDQFAHIGYTKLKFTSESESEVSFSDDDDDESRNHKRNELEKDSVVQCISQMCYSARPSLLDSCVPLDFQKYDGEEVFASDKSGTCSLVDLDWDKENHKVILSALPELIMLDDISTLSTTIEKSRLKLPPAQDSEFSEISELIILDDAPPSAGTSPVKSAEETGPFDTGSADMNRHDDALGFVNTSVGECSEIDRVVYDISTIKAKIYDDHDMSKSCPCNREGETPSSSAEQSIKNDSDMVIADRKTLSLKNSVAEDFNSSSKKSFQDISYCDNELQMVNASSFNEPQVEKQLASEECDVESLDESNVSEIEGESIVSRLRRQIENDKKQIISLHKELEEERNASEVAVNQAMAMIMRLQEEKAALNLDALQYLRMMEEQAEYDVDALEKANDLLAEKEKEIQDLEAELEMYRLNPMDDKVAVCIPKKSCAVEEEFTIGDMIDGIPSKSSDMIDGFPSKSSDIISSKSIANGISDNSHLLLVVKSSTLEFEDEKMYIKRCLMSLEKKLKQMSCKGASFSVSNGLHIERESLNFENVDFNEMMENVGLSPKRNRQSQNADDDDSSASVRDDVIYKEENLKPTGETKSSHQKKLDLASLENEVSDLNDRLEALEAGLNFLEHSLSTLGNGNEGLQFIQEVVYQLKELQKLGVTLSCQFEA